MSRLSEEYFRRLSETSEEAQLYDEDFLTLQLEYSKELEQAQFDEVRRTFMSDGEWAAEQSVLASKN